MSNLQLITQESNRELASKRMADGKINFKFSDMCGISTPLGLKDSDSDDTRFHKMRGARKGKSKMPDFDEIKKYGSALDVPKKCFSMLDENGEPKTMSVREMVRAGVFTKKRIENAPQGSSNTLLPDWEQFWEAMKFDLSIKKTVNPTIRENIYNIVDMPNSSQKVGFREFFSYAVVFKEHNGAGQPVNMGETRGGQIDDVTHKLYSAGFSVELIAKLFDRSLDFDKMNDGVIEGYNSLRDDLAISPIINGTYAGGKTTDADTTGSNREEKLYLTIENAVDAFAQKLDPVTKQEIGAEGLVFLTNKYDSMHIRRVISGNIKKSGFNTDRGFEAIPEINKILGYNGNSIDGRMESEIYAGVPSKVGFLIMPCTGPTGNRYMNIGVKRNLQSEVDENPNVKTLEQENRAWWFCECIYYAEGINSFVQKIQLPVW